MLFFTHLVAAALLGHFSRLSAAWVVAGAALPDILDKPLGALGIVELYHSVGHSVLFAALLIPVVMYGRVGVAVAVGWGSHLCLDALHIVINGRPGHAVFLFWPIVEPVDPLAIPPGDFVRYYLGTPSFYLEVILWVVLIALVLRRTLFPRG